MSNVVMRGRDLTHEEQIARGDFEDMKIEWIMGQGAWC